MDKKTVKILKIFNDSLSRCQRDPEFIPKFYSKFLSSSPTVREKFARTGFNKQNKMLKASLYKVLSAYENPLAVEKYLESLAERHSRRGVDIRPELYSLWLDSLLMTVKELDPKFTPEVENAWSEVMSEGIKYMKSKY